MKRDSRDDGLVTSKSLIQQMKARVPEAWERVCHVYTPLVYGWVRRANLSEQDAADVVQEVFRSVSNGIDGFRHNKPGDTFRGWLLAIARNEIRDWYRRQQKVVSKAIGGSSANVQLSQLPDWVDSEEEFEDDPKSKHAMIRRAAEIVKDDFKPNTWQAFWETVIEERTTAEVAERLGLSAGAIRQARFRVLARLREVLE